jgi:membrane dipeptidase
VKTNSRDWSRKDFIVNLSGLGAAILFKPGVSLAKNPYDPDVAEIVAKTMGIDTHNHVDVPLNVSELPGPNIDIAGEMKKSGLSAICMTFAVDYQKLTREGEAYERFTNGLNAMDEALERNNIKRSLNLDDLRTAYKNHEPTVVQSVEGAHFLEGKLERLELAYNRGLRHFGLLHDSDASVPLGDVYTNPPKWGGLTAFGKDVIRECNRLGILVDLTHCSNDTMNDALNAATQPVIISHTGLDTQLGQNESMAKMMRPRLISRQQAKIVAESGGVIGVWTHLSDTPLEYAQNIRAMVDVVGADHVCIGTDTKLTLPYRSPNDNGGNPPGPPPRSNIADRQDSANQNKKPPNFPNSGKRPGERTNEAWADQKVGFYYAVVDALLKTGFGKNEISKIAGGNFCRVFYRATSNQ